jgi:ABC-type transporter MlaC component
MSVTKELTQRVRFLRNAAPQQFKDFKTAFEAYTQQSYENLVQTTENLQQAQGRAQQCLAILDLLTEGVDHNG